MSFDVCKVDHYAWGAAFHSPVSWWQCEITGMWCSGWDTKQNYNASAGLGQEKAGGQHVHKHLKYMQRHAIQLLPSKCIKLHGPIQCFCKRLWSMLPCIFHFMYDIISCLLKLHSLTLTTICRHLIHSPNDALKSRERNWDLSFIFSKF